MPNLPCLPIARGLPVVLVLATVGTSTVRADSLRWKLTPGETLHYVNEQKTKVMQTLKDRQMEVVQSQTVDMSRKVQSVGPDGPPRSSRQSTACGRTSSAQVIRSTTTPRMPRIPKPPMPS